MHGAYLISIQGSARVVTILGRPPWGQSTVNIETEKRKRIFKCLDNAWHWLFFWTSGTAVFCPLVLSLTSSSDSERKNNSPEIKNTRITNSEIEFLNINFSRQFWTKSTYFAVTEKCMFWQASDFKKPLYLDFGEKEWTQRNLDVWGNGWLKLRLSNCWIGQKLLSIYHNPAEWNLISSQFLIESFGQFLLSKPRLGVLRVGVAVSPWSLLACDCQPVAVLSRGEYLVKNFTKIWEGKVTF